MLNKLENNLFLSGKVFIENYFSTGDERIIDFLAATKILEILNIVTPEFRELFMEEITEYYEHNLHMSTLYVSPEVLQEKANINLVNRFKELLNVIYGKICWQKR